MPFDLRYPTAENERLFSGYLEGLDERRLDALNALLDALEAEAKPKDPSFGFFEMEPDRVRAMSAMLIQLEGIGVRKKPSGRLMNLYGRYRATAGGVTVIYDIDEKRRIVWLLGIRDQA